MRLKTIAQILVLALLVLSGVAQAQATRTWVSGFGDDANPCSRTAPCKTFAGAISKTAAGGELDVQDPGGFGTLTITKAVTIEADGLIGGISGAGTNGVNIVAGATDRVTLRGLTIDGIGTGFDGVKIQSAGRVSLEHCYINNFTQNGLEIAPNGTNQTGGTAIDVFIRDTVFTNNGAFGASADLTKGGLFANAEAFSATTPTNINVVLDDVRFQANAWGIRGIDATNIIVNGGGVFESKFFGMRVEASTFAANLFLNDTNSSNNGTSGLTVAGAKATARLTRTALTLNATGVSISGGGVANTFGDNPINGNVTDVSGTPTTVGFH
jgi:hypothetical protein